MKYEVNYTSHITGKRASRSICMCMCHRKGINMKHIMACCDFTYKPYINEDGTLDAPAFIALMEMLHETDVTVESTS